MGEFYINLLYDQIIAKASGQGFDFVSSVVEEILMPPKKELIQTDKATLKSDIACS